MDRQKRITWEFHFINKLETNGLSGFVVNNDFPCTSTMTMFML